MKKRFLLAALAALVLPRLGVSAACVNESLASYVALPATGCTIGNNTLSNFAILTGFGSPIDPGAVTVDASGGNYNPMLTISTNQAASNNNPLELFFTYDITGLSYVGISTVLSPASETLDGGVTGLVNYCEGGNFGPDGVSGCNNPSGSLLTLDTIQNSDAGSFANALFLNVTNDLIIDPGTMGTASGATFTNSIAAVPEPSGYAISALALMLVTLKSARSGRAKD